MTGESTSKSAVPQLSQRQKLVLKEIVAAIASIRPRYESLIDGSSFHRTKYRSTQVFSGIIERSFSNLKGFVASAEVLLVTRFSDVMDERTHSMEQVHELSRTLKANLLEFYRGYEVLRGGEVPSGWEQVYSSVDGLYRQAFEDVFAFADSLSGALVDPTPFVSEEGFYFEMKFNSPQVVSTPKPDPSGFPTRAVMAIGVVGLAGLLIWVLFFRA